MTKQNEAGYDARRHLKGVLFRRQYGLCLICHEPIESVLGSALWEDEPGKRRDAAYDEDGNEIGGICHVKCKKDAVDSMGSLPDRSGNYPANG